MPVSIMGEEHAHMVSPGIGTGNTPGPDTNRYDTGTGTDAGTDAGTGTDTGTDAGTDTR